MIKQENILDQIVAHKKLEIIAAKSIINTSELEKSEYFGRECYLLRDFILDNQLTGIIAEFKRKSPSKGIINDAVDVAEVTKSYVSAGASALSVLTDSKFFGGKREDLQQARKVNNIPILRKDFILEEYQIVEAKAWGADIILLIASILNPSRIQQLAKFSKSLGLNVLLEVHNLEELKRSLCDELDAVGINNRNLGTFGVTVDHSYNLLSEIPDQFLKISESGLSNPETVSGLKKAGFNGFLIGENFMKEANPGQAMKDFVKHI
ncbi:indole-3-glycerol phosphate synthase TrpC [Daejeonella oryzae]|uniref:indole-3-glycerol phosphate synthase TrpC n=1 Tax=Daejeonella oryzae TaxID=1122943 RepID=UPI00055D75EF|nr:indole-3-glycerol phosphate synthase TrpC [Daejeonella oryzae]